jgi:hypothetical protein
MVLPFFSPLVDSLFAGPEKAKNLGGATGLRLIQIRLALRILKKSHLLVKHNRICPTRVCRQPK